MKITRAASCSWWAAIALLLVPIESKAQGATIDFQSKTTYRQYGDILIPIDAPSTESALKGNKWVSGNVYYSFDSSVEEQNQNSFRQWLIHWENSSGVRFIESAVATDRIIVVDAPGSIGCGSSFVGRQGGTQPLYISCWTAHTVLHELGHALGLIHEQQRADRDNFITLEDHGVIQYCGQATWNANFGIVATSVSTAYDYASVMHYSGTGFYTCGANVASVTITALQAQPDGLPSGSPDACTSAGACQSILGHGNSNDPEYPVSMRDGYGLSLRYGYRIRASVAGNGGGTFTTSGQIESCGTNCWQVSPQAVFTLSATPNSGSLAYVSGPCARRKSCSFTPEKNSNIVVKFFRKSAIAASAAMLTSVQNSGQSLIYSDGFESIP